MHEAGSPPSKPRPEAEAPGASASAEAPGAYAQIMHKYALYALITQTLSRNYARYAKITQNYAKLRKNYAQEITQKLRIRV